MGIFTLDKHNITQSRHDKWLLNVRPGSTHSNNHGIGGSYIMGIPDRGVMLASKVTIYLIKDIFLSWYIK